MYKIGVIIFHKVPNERRLKNLRKCIQQNLQRQYTKRALLDHFVEVVDNEVVEYDKRRRRYILYEDGHEVLIQVKH